MDWRSLFCTAAYDLPVILPILRLRELAYSTASRIEEYVRERDGMIVE